MEEKQEQTQETKIEKSEEKKGIPDNVVFIGTKPFMNYVNAVQQQFQDQKEVSIKARGKNINRAVDVEEVITKKFMNDEIEVAEIKLGSEEFEPREGNKNKKISVSSIEIRLRKKSN